MKKIIFFLSAFIFLFSTVSPLRAQGTCSCTLNMGSRVWYVGQNNCSQGYQPDGCRGTANSDPNATCKCIPVGNTNSCQCDGAMRVINNSCGSKYPICYGQGSNIICTCNDNLPTSALSEGRRRQNNLCDNGVSVKTVLGCVPVEMGAFIKWLLPYLFGIAGGISFLLMIYGFFLMGTSQGDPKKVEGAKETVTSAITGLLVCIFAIFILRLIAIDILHIPGIN